MYGEFPDGFRMTYQEMLDTLLTGETLCGVGGHKIEDCVVMRKLIMAHGGDPKMYYSRDGINA